MQLTKLPEAVALPDMPLPNVEGKTVSLQSFRDQVVLMNFWTTW
jgi:peroxiredoxin